MCDCVSAKITAIDYPGVTSGTGLLLRIVLPRFFFYFPETSVIRILRVKDKLRLYMGPVKT